MTRISQVADCFDRECKHFLYIQDRPGGGQINVCDAFPKGIPNKIAFEGNGHTTPFPGDHGIQFEKGEREE